MKHAVKKTWVFVLCILLGLTVGITSGWLVWNKEPVQPFGPLEYRYLADRQDYLPGDIPEKGLENVGKIKNAEDAIEKGGAQIEKYFADEWEGYDSWKERHDLYVTYAVDMDIWYVTSRQHEWIKPLRFEQVPHVVINGDGEVFSVWIE